MSAQNHGRLKALLEASGLLDRAVKVDDSVYHLQWGSAEVVVGTTKNAVGAFAPMFEQLPTGQESRFCRRLLELNSVMGGVASFAIQTDGWVVLQAGRSINGIDAHEFADLVSTVGQFADMYDDQLYSEFLLPPQTEDDPEDDPESDPEGDPEGDAKGDGAPVASPDASHEPGPDTSPDAGQATAGPGDVTETPA